MGGLCKPDSNAIFCRRVGGNSLVGGLCKPDSNAIFCRRELRFPTLRCCSVGRNSDSRLIELFVVVRLWEGFLTPTPNPVNP